MWRSGGQEILRLGLRMTRESRSEFETVGAALAPPEAGRSNTSIELPQARPKVAASARRSGTGGPWDPSPGI